MIQTARLLLRPWLLADAPALLTLMHNDRARFTPDFPVTLAAVQDMSSTTAFIQRKMQAWQRREEYQVGVWQLGARQLLGFISLKNLDWSVPKAELAYLLAASAEGQGLMSEALPAFLRWAFAELRLERVFCRIKAANTRSRQLAQKTGFQWEGTLRQDFRDDDGQLTDMLYLGLLRTDFVASAPETT
jgi:ribosomal-protein-alanine N-acetyltransferase